MSLNVQKIPFIRFPNITDSVKIVINEVLENGVYFNGEYTRRFVKDFSEYLNLDSCIPTANCTDSLEIILRAKNITKDDEVIVPAFTWFSDASVVELVGAKLVFVDIDLVHFGMDVDDFASKITNYTKAVILPHLFGVAHPQINAIKTICNENNIFLIEDCAQAHGASLNGKLAGTFGDVAAFSFYPTKNLGALGDAGAILTNDTELAEKCRLWANHGQINRNNHVQIGKNSRMDELQAAVLSTKLPYLNHENNKRREFAGVYFNQLNDLPITLPMNYPGHVYHQFVIMTEERDQLKSYLSDNNIETDIHYPNALVNMAPFKYQHTESFENALKAAETVLSLPIHPNHSVQDIHVICEMVKSFFKE